MNVDHGDLIARLSCNIQILQQFDPDGRWQHDPLLLGYLRDRYSLSLKQAHRLDAYLAEELNLATAKFSDRQTDLFG